jgi:uncharacterized protein
MPILIATIAGLLFGAGLALSGMTDPLRVQAFLDLFGKWDPTLAFVMGGAMIPMALAWIVQRRMTKPVAATDFSLPETQKIDSRLAIGALIFGVGWGISGLCPGPAIASLPLGGSPAFIFFLAMIAGMFGFRFLAKK